MLTLLSTLHSRHTQNIGCWPDNSAYCTWPVNAQLLKCGKGRQKPKHGHLIMLVQKPRVENVQYFMNMFTSIADICIPHYEATIRPNDKNFMNSEIRHKMNVRDHYWKQYLQTNLEEYHDKFKEIRNEVVYAIRESKINIEKKKNDLVSKTKVGSKKWWSLYKSVLNGGVSSTLGPFKDR